ncbi:MAG: SpoIID/LytB domain-containing protein [Cyanobium sp. LacPavin_0920_WC12_MAG_62_9]|nr:SpoIID/LytB domain-containing protein [Cyanobium sp. LacPavin_0920_WC12_MAG_62_9]
MDLLAGVAAAVVPYFRNWLTSAALVGAALAPQALLAQAVIAQQGEPQVRVLLVEGPTLTVAATDHPLALRGLAQAPGGPVILAAGDTVTLTLVGGAISVQRNGQAPGDQVMGSGQTVWLEPLASGLALGHSKPAGDFQLKQRNYRGRLLVAVNGSVLQAVNYLDLESYLPSVVGSEMPASWPQAALRAQAVAARTYALRQRSASKPFDVSATVASQVYKGVEAETSSTREAVASTRGEVLMYGGSLVNAVFHSSSGGSTENSGDLWVQQLPYLVSVPDVDQASPVSRWQQRLEPLALAKAFGEIGGANRIEILSTTSSGRVRQARVIGPSGTLVLTGAELRSRLGLRSTMVRFELVGPDVASSQLPPSGPPILPPLAGSTAPLPDAPAQAPIQVPQATLLAVGRGFGHGVGMSQWGAYALAQRGEGYPEILRYYFRGTDLRPYNAP